VTTGEEMDLLAANKDIATVEFTPQHLTLVGPDDYVRIQGLRPDEPAGEGRRPARCSVAGGEPGDPGPHRLGSCAAHEGIEIAAISGVTFWHAGGQTIAPVMLTHVADGKMSLERFIELTSAEPQRLFGIAGKGHLAQGYDADFTIVDMKARKTITHEWSVSRCGWTPFDGMEAKAWPMATFVRGVMVMCDGALVAPGRGEPVRFVETLVQA